MATVSFRPHRLHHRDLAGRHAPRLVEQRCGPTGVGIQRGRHALADDPAGGRDGRAPGDHTRRVSRGVQRPGNLEKEIHWWIKNTGPTTPATPSTWPRSGIEEYCHESLGAPDSAGNIQSVAVPNPDLPGKLHLEVEGGQLPVSSRSTNARSGGRTCSATRARKRRDGAPEAP